MVLKLSMLQNTLLLVGAFSAIWFGIYGLLYSLVLVNILITFTNAYFSGKLINYGLNEQIKDLTPIIVLNSVLAIAFYYIQTTWLNQLSDLLNLIVLGFGFLITYIGIAFIFKMRVIKDLMAFRKN